MSRPAIALRAAACAALVTGLLSAWVTIGGAGTISHVELQVTLAAIPAGPSGAAETGAYLRIRNYSGRAYQLTAASSPAARRVRVRGRAVIPAHSAVTLSPFGSDIELAGLRVPPDGQPVPLTLVFGPAGRVTVSATVVPPGPVPATPAPGCTC